MALILIFVFHALMRNFQDHSIDVQKINVEYDELNDHVVEIISIL